jgi:ATP-dependent DNA ligase
VFAAACRMGLEGFMSKRIDAPYRSGRSRDWIKTKNPACPGDEAGSRGAILTKHTPTGIARRLRFARREFYSLFPRNLF